MTINNAIAKTRACSVDAARIAVAALVLSLITPGPQGNAFEIGTHAGITFAAYRNSQLQSSNSILFRDLGFQTAPDTTKLGNEYHDFDWSLGGHSRLRLTWNYEAAYIDKMAGAPYRFTSAGWLIAGAVREDDYAPFLSFGGSRVQDDPYAQPPMRPLNHFFDPVNNRPLTLLGAPQGQKAPDWALGVEDGFADPNAEYLARRNHFAIMDAREAMYRALTLHAKNHTDGSFSSLGPYSPQEQEKERKRYWATAFRALGSVVHLLQDMAQPQHTRNEPHNGLGDYTTEALVFGHEAILEQYLEARAMQVELYT